MVAKFTLQSVKDILEPGTAKLTLSGVTGSGQEFFGTDTIRVLGVSGN